MDGLLENLFPPLDITREGTSKRIIMNREFQRSVNFCSHTHPRRVLVVSVETGNRAKAENVNHTKRKQDDKITGEYPRGFSR